MLDRAPSFIGMALVMGTLGGCSPFGGHAFTCTTDDQCAGKGEAGKCEVTVGLCSFPDPSCNSGRRYGELSGALSKTCVGDEHLDGSVDTPAGSDSSGSADAMSDAQSCFGTGLVTECFNMPPSGTTTIPSGNFVTSSTGGSSLCAAQISASCVVAANDIVIAPGTLNVTGNRPLVLVAANTITVTGSINIASHHNGQQGAASDFASCNAGTAPSGGGGGAGGSFGGMGGDGGGGGARGIAGAPIAATTLHGGCRGQDGSGATGAHGGGAVYLIANTSITITGGINASGAGASGGSAASSGAAGGGSGGLIGLDSPTVLATGAQIFANGGGGGEGGSTGGNAGADGADPANPATPALGGSGNTTSGGDGGNGAAGVTVAMPGITGTASGGGGGGAVGVIRLFRATSITGGMVSPAPS